MTGLCPGSTGLVSVNFGVLVCGLEILDCPEELDELEVRQKPQTLNPKP